MTSKTVNSSGAPKSQFIRNHLIWVYYGLVGLNLYIVSALGPLMPFLRSELHLNYQLAGLHFSGVAVGSVIAGTTGDALLNRLGRVQTLVIGVLATIASILGLILAHHPAISIGATSLAGFSTGVTYQALATIIADHLGELRTFAFVEAEAAAMIGAGIAPFAVGACVSAGFGWRGALIVLLVAFVALIPRLSGFGRVNASGVEETLTRGKLPLTFWAYSLVIFLSVAAEWSTAFWSADYLCDRLSITKATAAGAVGAFFIGMVVGRLGGSRLVRLHNPAGMLVASGFISIAGFVPFWLAHDLFINVAGLFLTGLGIANMYPLSFSAAVASAPSLTRKAVARIGLMCGMSSLVAPFALSYIADRTGLMLAYFVVAVSLLLCLVSIFAANFIAKKSNPAKVRASNDDQCQCEDGKIACDIHPVELPAGS